MKVRVILFATALSSTAIAQPTPQPQPQPEQPPGEAPSWLPGILQWNDPVATPPGADVITLDEAIAMAMQNRPDVRTVQASFEQAQARIELARVAQRPSGTLSASAAMNSTWWSKQGGGFIPGQGNNLTTTGGFLDPTFVTGIGASASWRLYDFGLTKANIYAAEAAAVAAEANVETTMLTIRRNVEAAYLAAVARSRLVRVAEATVLSEEQHLDQARRFVAAQVKDPIEVAQAQARYATAKSSLAQAQSNEAIALATLRATLGWMDAKRSPVVDPAWPAPQTDAPADLAALVETAREQRPEVLALDKQIAATEASLDASLAERRPILSASAQTQWNPRTNDWAPVPTWAAGLSLTWNLFDGGRAAANQRIARANVKTAVAQRDSLVIDIVSQLDSARAQIVANTANLEASTEAVTAARRQLQLADARYAQGLGSQIELADAQTAVTTAEGNLVLAQFQLADARVSLRRALGTK